MVKTVRPLVSRMTTLPIAGDQVFAAVERLHRNLDAVRHILADEAMSSVRLVVNPEKMVIAEARRTYTYLGLFGYRVDAVVVNRIIPDEVDRPVLRQVEGHPGRAPRDRPRVVRAGADPRRRGCSTARWSACALLAEMGDEVYGERRGHRRCCTSTIRSACEKRGDGYVLWMRLPFISRDDMDMHRRGEELFVRVGPYKRNLILPQTLKRLVVRGASLVDEHLEIAFERSPEGEPGEGAER